MSKNNWRPGSMGAADEKANRRFFIAGIITIILLALIAYTPIGNWYPYELMKRNTSWTKWFGVLSFVLSIVAMIKLKDYPFGSRSGWVYGFIVLAFIFLGFGLAAGFDFSLRGITPR